MDMKAMLATQRAAFTAALPEPLSVRRDRLKRTAAMVRDNARRFCDAVSEDFGHGSREQSMLTDIAASISLRNFPVDLVVSPLAGGVGPSGMGSYHGHDGFKTFSHARAVFRHSRLDVAKLAGLKPS
ncbi:hypothetical protein [uncultured Sphingomonas sp.]|uniref:hypothetical protein n=1 Tax=uncultured Sphingomonas sp. TaxID=158754 RepID=UPI0035CC1B6A